MSDRLPSFGDPGSRSTSVATTDENVAAPAAFRPLSRSASTAQFGVIVFLASDVMLFAPFFAAYFLLRATNQQWPPAGVELDVPRAFAATLVLVASSFTLIASDRAGERPGGGRAMRRWLLVTIGLGVVFISNQLLEYRALDFGADSNPYGSVYYMVTGLHGLHVTVGVAAMALLFVRAARAGSQHEVATWAGGVSLFWHLVDLIWVFLFSTIWLLQ